MTIKYYGCIILLAALSKMAKAADVLGDYKTPTDGSFFYASLNNAKGVNYVTFNVGSAQ